MATSLTDDADYQAATFLVIDFETTTPPGAPPEPIEVAVAQLRPDAGGALVEHARHQALMRPPAHAPVTRFDIDQTGITPADVADQPPAPDVLAALDAHTPTGPGPVLLVAHHAPVEAAVLYAYRHACPRLAQLRLLDTVTMARHAHPGLASYSLDNLLHALNIPPPEHRHRAMADVEVTTTLFRHLLTAGRWRSLAALLAAAARTPKAAAPNQQALF